MSRTKKNANIAEQIKNVEVQIEKAEKELKDLKKQKAELLDQKKRQDLESLYQMISESGKTIEEVKEMLK